ncbi:hypothetical protein D4764_09G0004950 [Takifugu flavidus]|uniref:Uncharacterized protein n=1 Tax=Takifugu flavidus TaxID=433684 RepID=A0A5C6MJV8_9TELE|nr:hypothetical protein D4764_09G0004950 [Takifugu flavidus]
MRVDALRGGRADVCICSRPARPGAGELPTSFSSGEPELTASGSAGGAERTWAECLVPPRGAHRHHFPSMCSGLDPRWPSALSPGSVFEQLVVHKGHWCSSRNHYWPPAKGQKGPKRCRCGCHRLTEERDEAERQLKHIKRGESSEDPGLLSPVMTLKVPPAGSHV